MTKQDISENQAKNIYLGVGSNLGNRITNIEKAKSLLEEKNIKLIAISRYYETPSWPNPKYPKFINIVLKIRCQIEPCELLRICKSIENISSAKTVYPHQTAPVELPGQGLFYL